MHCFWQAVYSTIVEAPTKKYLSKRFFDLRESNLCKSSSLGDYCWVHYCAIVVRNGSSHTNVVVLTNLNDTISVTQWEISGHAESLFTWNSIFFPWSILVPNSPMWSCIFLLGCYVQYLHFFVGLSCLIFVRLLCEPLACHNTNRLSINRYKQWQ